MASNTMELDKITKCTVGVALLVSNEYTGDDALYVTHKDADNLGKLFREKFAYFVFRMKNITADQFEASCGALAKHQYPKNCKRILVYFSGHGGYGALQMQDGSQVEIDKLVNLFKTKTSVTNNKVLSEMAKMFFIDACRGHDEDSGYVIRGGSGEASRVPTEGNILVAYASTKYHVSYEGNDGGRWTNCLIQALSDSDERDDVCTILTSANKMLRANQLKENPDGFQSAEFTSSLTTFVHFKRERLLRDYTKIEKENCQLVTQYGGKKFSCPRGIAIGPHNEIIMVDSLNKEGIIFDEGLKLIQTFGQDDDDGKLHYPVGVSVNLNVIAVSDYGDHTVKLFSLQGNYLSKFGTYGDKDDQFFLPGGLCFNSKGLVYVTDTDTSGVKVFTNGAFLKRIGLKGYTPRQIRSPFCIAVDSSDQVYVANYCDHNGISLLNEDGHLEKICNHPFVSCTALCITPDDYIITENNNALTVFSCSPAHELIREFGECGDKEGQFDGICDIAINNSGTIYVTEEKNKRLQIIKP